MALMRYFRNIATGEWLARVDGNPVASVAEAVAHAGAEYGAPVEVAGIFPLKVRRKGAVYLLSVV